MAFLRFQLFDIVSAHSKKYDVFRMSGTTFSPQVSQNL